MDHINVVTLVVDRLTTNVHRSAEGNWDLAAKFSRGSFVMHCCPGVPKKASTAGSIYESVMPYFESAFYDL